MLASLGLSSHKTPVDAFLLRHKSIIFFGLVLNSFRVRGVYLDKAKSSSHFFPTPRAIKSGERRKIMAMVSDQHPYRVPSGGSSNLPTAVSHQAINTSLGNAPCQSFEGAGILTPVRTSLRV